MEKLELNKNGILSTVATIDSVGGSEHVILGDYQRNLILRTKGSVRIQVNNKFYDLISDNITPSTDTSNSGVIIVSGAIGTLNLVPSEGSLIYATDPKGLYIVLNGVVTQIDSDVDGGDTGTIVSKDYVSYSSDQLLTDSQLKIVQSNIGAVYQDVTSFTLSNWEKKIAFVESQNRHLIYLNGTTSPLYVSHAIGGVVNGGLTLSNSISVNDTSKALLYVDSLRSNNTLAITDGYEGFFVGSDGFNVGLGIHTDGREVFLNYTAPLNFLNKDRVETLRLENDVIYMGGIYENHLTSVKGFLDTEILTVSKLAKTKNATIVDGNNYFNQELDTSKGFSLEYINEEWVLQVDEFLKTSKSEKRGLHGTGQCVLSDPARILNIDYASTTELSIRTDESTFASGDLILGIANNEDNRIIGFFTGEILEVELPAPSESYRVLHISLNNVSGIDLELGHSYMHIIKINNANVLLDSKTNSIIGYNKLTSIMDNLSETDLTVITNAVNTLGMLHFKPNNDSIHTIIGNLSSKIDPLFEMQGEGFYSNNAYIKGKAELSYLKLGDSFLFEDGALNITETYAEYGLGVTVAVPYDVSKESGMYGVVGSSLDTPVSGMDGSILKMQSATLGNSSELWLSGADASSTPQLHIRNVQGVTKGLWVKVATSADLGNIGAGHFVAGVFAETGAYSPSMTPTTKRLIVGGGADNATKKDVFYVQHDGLVIATNDIEITDPTKGIVLKSANGSRWRITIDDAGVLTPTALP